MKRKGENDYKCGGAGRGLVCAGCGRDQCQLNVHDYMADLPDNTQACDLVEVQFKNTRKGYYANPARLPLRKGDTVAVEASPGHDVGVVTLTGRLALAQLAKERRRPSQETPRVYRLARDIDLQRWREAKALEHDTMIEAREIARALGLAMKIGDVEYQGDGARAIFYYIADGRVDFRQLIKDLAQAFHVRIEMRQIGARQEAGRIGGFGPCGRELCCATWLRGFHSVSAHATKVQELNANPQKFAGQCAKLRCCMNYEVDQYVEAAASLPDRSAPLETQDKTYHVVKADPLAQTLTYGPGRHATTGLVTITAGRAREVMDMNRQGRRPQALATDAAPAPGHAPQGGAPAPHVDLAAQDDLARFDRKRRGKPKARRQPPAPGARAPRPPRPERRPAQGAPRPPRQSPRPAPGTGRPRQEPR